MVEVGGCYLIVVVDVDDVGIGVVGKEDWIVIGIVFLIGGLRCGGVCR